MLQEIYLSMLMNSFCNFQESARVGILCCLLFFLIPEYIYFSIGDAVTISSGDLVYNPLLVFQWEQNAWHVIVSVALSLVYT